MDINVLDGDIMHVPADAIITAINSGGMWFGGIDGLLMSAAGNQFHDQAADALARDRHTQTVIATSRRPHLGFFDRVVFVIDDLEEPLNVVVRRGLNAASVAGIKRVAMPLIRFGVMAEVGGTRQSKVHDIAMAIQGQTTDVTNRLESLTVAVYGDLELSTMLRHELNLP